MKTKFSILLFLVMLFSSCSSDDAEQLSKNTDGITVNGVLFTPEIELTSYDETNATRRLSLFQGLDGFVLNIPSATAEDDISGDYNFRPAAADPDSRATGYYSANNTTHSIFFGTLTITDFRNGTYKVSLNEVKIYTPTDNQNPIYQIGGFYQGIFLDNTSAGKPTSARPIIF